MRRKSTAKVDDDILPEYDLRKLPIIAYGPGHKKKSSTTVNLAPDVAAVFPDDQSVNEALRLLIRIAKTEVKYSR